MMENKQCRKQPMKSFSRRNVGDGRQTTPAMASFVSKTFHEGYLLMPINSTSNINVALGGIKPPPVP